MRSGLNRGKQEGHVMVYRKRIMKDYLHYMTGQESIPRKCFKCIFLGTSNGNCKQKRDEKLIHKLLSLDFHAVFSCNSFQNIGHLDELNQV